MDFRGEKISDQLSDCSVLDKALFVLNVLGHNGRKKILRLLEVNSSLTVTEIYIKMRLTQSETSFHLAQLRKTGIVDAIREGKYVFYSLNRDRFNSVMQQIFELANGTAGK